MRYVLLLLALCPAIAQAQEVRDADGWDKSPRWRDHGFGGFTARVAGAMPMVMPGASSLVGFGGSFRIHGAPALALEIAYDAFDGASDSARRRDQTLGLHALFYPSPGGRTQPYFIFGAGHAWQSEPTTGHFAATVGGGFEWFVTEKMALSWDVRALVRSGDDALPWNRGPISGTSWGLVFGIGVSAYVFGK
jgi:hypothetical protein